MYFNFRIKSLFRDLKPMYCLFQLLIHREVHSVINLVEQTQDTNPLSVPQTTKLTLPQAINTANNTIQQTQIRLHRRHPHGGTILQAEMK